MANDNLKRAALQRRAELEAELHKIDAILGILGGGGNALPAPAVTAPPPKPDQPGRAERNGMKKAMRDAIVARGKPLSRVDLVAALKAAGSPLKSKNPANYVGTMMWRWRDEFVNFKGIGYWPSDLQYEPTMYFPSEK